MNANHARLCPSPEWADHMQATVLPRVVADHDLGGDLLEVGPGPGATTEWLRHRVGRLTAVEIDPGAAELLRARYADSNVTVVQADATALPFDEATFDSAGSFTMLHHVPTERLQNRIFSEVLRVLRPGGVFVGSDSLAGTGLHEFHVDDTYNPLEPASLLTRLRTLGFDAVTVSVGRGIIFAATKTGARKTEAVDGS